MTKKLYQKKCSACSGETPKLSESQIEQLLKQIKEWQLSDNLQWLYKEFKFKNFQQTLDFVNQISKIAEEENHHPNINFTWGYCKISIQTHKIKGLCENDFILAAKIDQIS